MIEEPELKTFDLNASDEKMKSIPFEDKLDTIKSMLYYSSFIAADLTDSISEFVFTDESLPEKKQNEIMNKLDELTYIYMTCMHVWETMEGLESDLRQIYKLMGKKQDIKQDTEDNTDIKS